MNTAAGTTWPRRRVGGLAVGVVLLLASLGSIGAGAFAAIAGSGGTDVELGAHGSYRSDGYALATDETNWRTQLFGWAGAVRLEVAPAGRKPIFVGVAPADAVRRYLAGAAYTTVAEHTGHGVVRTDHDGAAPEASAGVDWTATAEGAGTQTLRWTATDRPQVVVAMNADGSRPVRVRVVSSAVTLDRMPWWVPAGALALGVALLALGVVLFRRTIRPRTAPA